MNANGRRTIHYVQLHDLPPDREAIMLQFHLCRILPVLALLYLSDLQLPAGAQTKPDPARWEKTIAGFEEADKKTPPPENAVLFVGSSSIVRWDLKKSFPGLEAVNRGFGGSQISDVNHYLTRVVLRYKPRTIVFYSGDNDIASGKSAENVAADLKAFVQGVHQEAPKAKIVILGIKPSPARRKFLEVQRQANRLIAEFCKLDARLAYVDVEKAMLGNDAEPMADLFVADKLHLSAKGYELWTGLVKPHVR